MMFLLLDLRRITCIAPGLLNRGVACSSASVEEPPCFMCMSVSLVWDAPILSLGIYILRVHIGRENEAFVGPAMCGSAL